MTMSMIDLSGYNLSELKGLLFDIEKELKGRQLNEVNKAREQVLAIAQNLGVSLEDLLGSTVKKTKVGKAEKGQARYKNPTDHTQTWSGRGRQPRWMAEGLASGKKFEDFLI